MEDVKKEILRLSLKIGAFSPADKKSIKALAQEAGINVTFRGSCQDCYGDAVHLLRKHYGVTAKEKIEAEIKCRDYRLKVTPCKVYHRGDWLELSEDMTCDDIARFRELIGERFSYYFEEIKK